MSPILMSIEKKRLRPLRKCLVKYFTAITGVLPNHLDSFDVHRLTVLYFGVGGLALLGELPDDYRTDFINFVYAHQIHPSKEYGSARCGFRGSSFIGAPMNPDYASLERNVFPYDSCHVTMNYSALVILLLLGDDLSRVNRQAVLDGMLALHNFGGSLMPASLFCPEFDARFIFSAVATAYILDMLDQFDLDAFEKQILNSMSYEGAFGQLPHLEAHAGATYCSLAALHLMGRLEKVLPSGSLTRQRLVNWLLHRQVSGFNGRPGKDADTCYTFWVGASLKMLGSHQHITNLPLLKFLCLTCEPTIGGFMKSQDSNYADPLHSYLALAGLSALFCDPPATKKSDAFSSLLASFPSLQLAEEKTPTPRDLFEEICDLVCGAEDENGGEAFNRSDGCLLSIVPQLNIPMSAFEHLKRIHAKWRATA